MGMGTDLIPEGAKGDTFGVGLGEGAKRRFVYITHL